MKKTMRRSSPLLDAPRLIHLILLWLWLLQFAAFGIVLTLLFLKGTRMPAGGLCFLGGIFILSFALVILTRPGGKPNAIYLRAFASDKDSIRLRGAIQAALGPAYRMVGIRAPRWRSNPFLQGIGLPLYAIKYALSSYFEMEAGNDWLLRLEMSLRKAKLAIVDARTWTPYVGQEIKLCMLALGPERCAILVCRDRGLPDEIEERLVAGALFVPVDPKNPAPELALIRTWSNELPATEGKVNPLACEYAKKKFEEEEAAKKEVSSISLWFTTAGRMVALLAGVSVLSASAIFILSSFASVTSVSPTESTAQVAVNWGGSLVIAVACLWPSYRRWSLSRRFGGRGIFTGAQKPLLGTLALGAAFLLQYHARPDYIQGTKVAYTLRIPLLWTYERKEPEFDLLAVSPEGYFSAIGVDAQRNAKDLNSEDLGKMLMENFADFSNKRLSVETVDGAVWAVLSCRKEGIFYKMYVCVQKGILYYLTVMGNEDSWNDHPAEMAEVAHFFSFPKG
ncbi:MAG: hypothetical protein V4689_19620 [Verrucomicrobiota bacterium]